MLDNFSGFCCRLLFFKINFVKILSRTLSECQMFWIQMRTDVLSVLIWVQTVFKGYKQTTNVATSKESVNYLRDQTFLSLGNLLSQGSGSV